MRVPIAVLATSLFPLLASCRGADEAGLTGRLDGAHPTPAAAAIINGEDDDATTAVVALFITDDAGNAVSVCSGAVIAAQIVLTAAHCVSPGEGFPTGARVFASVLSAPVDGSDEFVEVDDMVPHPGYDPLFPTNSHDVAMLHLVGPFPDGVVPQPARVTRTPFNVDDMGATLRAVGYGRTVTEEFTAPRRRSVEVEVLAFDSEMVMTDERGAGTCYGDSGGPYFIDRGLGEEIVSVTSFLMDTDGRCAASAVASARVDTELHTFIDPFVAQYMDITCDGGDFCAEDCERLDPDCPDGAQCGADDVCALGCAAPDPDCPVADDGDACSFGEQCSSGICVAIDDSEGTCATRCEPTDADGCGEGTTCASAGDDVNVCVTDSGCAASGGASGLLLLLLAGARRRTRPSASDPLPQERRPCISGGGGPCPCCSLAFRRS